MPFSALTSRSVTISVTRELSGSGEPTGQLAVAGLGEAGEVGLGSRALVIANRVGPVTQEGWIPWPPI